MFDFFFRNFSSNHVSCEDNPTKVLYDHCRYDDLGLHSRSQMRLKLDYFSTCKISDSIWATTLKLGMLVYLFMALNLTLTLKNVCKACSPCFVCLQTACAYTSSVRPTRGVAVVDVVVVIGVLYFWMYKLGLLQAGRTCCSLFKCPHLRWGKVGKVEE